MTDIGLFMYLLNIFNAFVRFKNFQWNTRIFNAVEMFVNLFQKESEPKRKK